MNWTPYFFRSFCLCSRTMLDTYWMWPERASVEGSSHHAELGPFHPPGQGHATARPYATARPPHPPPDQGRVIVPSDQLQSYDL